MTDSDVAETPKLELLTLEGFSIVAADLFDLKLNDDLQEAGGLLNERDGELTHVLVSLSAHADGRAFSLPALLENRPDLKFYATGDLIPEQATYLFACGYEGLVLSSDYLESYGREHWLSALRSRLQYPSQGLRA